VIIPATLAGVKNLRTCLSDDVKTAERLEKTEALESMRRRQLMSRIKISLGDIFYDIIYDGRRGDEFDMNYSTRGTFSPI